MPKRRSASLFILALLLCVHSIGPINSVYAQAPETKLKSVEQTLEETKAAQKELEQKTKKAEKDLKAARKKLVKTARTVQDSESSLQNIEEKISANATRQNELNTTLDQNRTELARLVMALQKMGRMPKEALITSPDTPYKTAQSALLMRSLIPTIQKQTDALAETLRELETVTATLNTQRAEAAEHLKALQAEEQELKTLLKKRETLFARTQEDSAANAKTIEKIAREAKDLKTLISALKTQRQEERTRAMKHKPSANSIQAIPTIGQETLPVPGMIVTRFNETDDFGAPSQGIKIKARGGSLIVAPMGGLVRFAGTFKNYGQMVILEHKKGYHSLIAGFEKIDTVVGQALSAGEPLGRLSTNRPQLYYELRKNGNPVNPATKFKGL